MALSKTLFLLCALFALVLLVSSEATSNAHSKDEKANELRDGGPGFGGGGPGFGGGGPGFGGGGPGFGGGGPGFGGGGPGFGGGGPGFGGGGPGFGGGGPGGGYGGGNRGGGGYGGRGCPYGCCRRYRYREGCDRCCRTANENPNRSFADDFRN